MPDINGEIFMRYDRFSSFISKAFSLPKCGESNEHAPFLGVSLLLPLGIDPDAVPHELSDTNGPNHICTSEAKPSGMCSRTFNSGGLYGLATWYIGACPQGDPLSLDRARYSTQHLPTT